MVNFLSIASLHVQWLEKNTLDPSSILSLLVRNACRFGRFNNNFVRPFCIERTPIENQATSGEWSHGGHWPLRLFVACSAFEGWEKNNISWSDTGWWNGMVLLQLLLTVSRRKVEVLEWNNWLIQLSADWSWVLYSLNIGFLQTDWFSSVNPLSIVLHFFWHLFVFFPSNSKHPLQSWIGCILGCPPTAAS